ncbi:LOW QUALITY PROTEIN: hypothetical protein PHPALM_28533, partial [Phytophthora palmivora]
HIAIVLVESNITLVKLNDVGQVRLPRLLCVDDEELNTEECSFCTKPVHHMRSNALCQDQLTLRVCSASCANALGLVNQSPTSATTSKPRSSSEKEVEVVLKPVAKTHTKKATTKRKANIGAKPRRSGKSKSTSGKNSKTSTQPGEQDTNRTSKSNQKKSQSRQEIPAGRYDGVIGHDRSDENAGLDNRISKRRKTSLSDHDKTNAATIHAEAGANNDAQDDLSNLREGGTDVMYSGSHARGDEDEKAYESNGSNIYSSNDAPVENRANKPNKFFFTPTADLALLPEMPNVQPKSRVENGMLPRSYRRNLKEHLETELGIRTVKEHFFLLAKELKATDCEYRKKSGVAEEYTEHKRLLQNITEEMRDLETKKRKKRKADQDKLGHLESAGAKIREQALMLGSNCGLPSR